MMAFNTLTSYPLDEGFHIVLLYLNDISNGLFTQTLLFTIWCIITFGVFFAQKRMTAFGDFPSSATAGSFITLMVASLFWIIPGLIDPITFTATLVVFLGSVALLFFSADRFL